mmetsp:Transcript_27829/g.42814  ORF Transcript_27829/g.42814 Transcript_27829/m.42814 type:complete len:109 (+) Transcript_27829:48-374(+)
MKSKVHVGCLPHPALGPVKVLASIGEIILVELLDGSRSVKAVNRDELGAPLPKVGQLCPTIKDQSKNYGGGEHEDEQNSDDNSISNERDLRSCDKLQPECDDEIFNVL